MSLQHSNESYIIVGLVLPIYILGIILPGVTLNGLIVVTFLRIKKLHTPSNLLAVHISVIGLLISLFYSTISIPAFALSVIECSCELTYYKWILAHIFHFALYPLNIAAITISYFLIIKYSVQILTFFRVTTVIVIMWLAAIIGNAPTVFLVPLNEFVTCCESSCGNSTIMTFGSQCNQLFSTHSHLLVGPVAYFVIQNIVFIALPLFTIVTLTIKSCHLLSKLTNPLLGRKLILSPLIMILTVIVSSLCYSIVHWVQLSVINQGHREEEGEGFRANLIPSLIGFLLDLNNVLWPLLVLYCNHEIRQECFVVVTCSKTSLFSGQTEKGVPNLSRRWSIGQVTLEESRRNRIKQENMEKEEWRKEWLDYVKNLYVE